MEQSPKPMTLSFVARALGLSFPGTDEELRFVTADSRRAVAGSLFVAIPGERVDGHDFIPAAAKLGARAVICREGFDSSPYPGTHFFAVKDTVAAYRRLAKAWRALFEMPVIAVAGSVGKTTTKEFLAALLRGKFTDVLRTQASQNGFLGIPMTLLELRAHHEAAVIEVGIDDVGAMEQHMRIVAATHAVLTTIGPEHLERLKNVDTVAREELIALTATASRGGTVIVNLDDPRIAPIAPGLPPEQTVSFSMTEPASLHNLHGRLSGDGLSLLISGIGLDGEHALPLPLTGKHNAGNLLCACACARTLGLTAKEMQDGLATFKGAGGRSELATLKGGAITVLLDYYNANPDSMAAGIATAAELHARKNPGGRLLAALGDMRELGTEEEMRHRDLAAVLATHGAAAAYLYGPCMKLLLDELSKKQPAIRAAHFATHEELAKALATDLRDDDTLIIKGSRGMAMEKVWERLSQS